MSIAPCGNRRLMVSQVLTDPLLQKDGKPINDAINTDGINPADVKLLNTNNGIPTQDTLEKDVEHIDRNKPDESVLEEQKAQQAENEANQDGSLEGYLFKKLQTFGNPGRRLMEYKDKFVEEDLGPSGEKTIKVVVPNRYYGKNQKISDKERNRMIKEIEHKFQLYFNGGKSSDKTLIMNFTSTNLNAQNPIEEPVEDTLSQVYGPGESKTKDKSSKNPVAKSTRKAANSIFNPDNLSNEVKAINSEKEVKIGKQTIKEMINANKDSVLDALIKILGEKNVN